MAPLLAWPIPSYFLFFLALLMDWTLSNYAVVCSVFPFIWFLWPQSLVYMDTLIIMDIIKLFIICCLLLLLIVKLDLTLDYGTWLSSWHDIKSYLNLVLVFRLIGLTFGVVDKVLTNTFLGLVWTRELNGQFLNSASAPMTHTWFCAAWLWSIPLIYSCTAQTVEWVFVLCVVCALVL